jgi:hypothetical protein
MYVRGGALVRKPEPNPPIHCTLEAKGTMGDYIYCERHPSQPISNGIFDAPCGACEYEMDQAAEAWLYDPQNTTRPYCKAGVYVPAYPWHGAATCQDTEDDIPF